MTGPLGGEGDGRDEGWPPVPRRRLIVALALFMAIPALAQPWTQPGPFQGHPETYARDLYNRYMAARRGAADARGQLAGDRQSTLEDIRASSGSMGDSFRVTIAYGQGADARRAIEQRIRDCETQMAALEGEWSQWCDPGLALGPLCDAGDPRKNLADPVFNPANGLIEYVNRDVVDFRIRYFLEEKERQARTDALRPPLASVVSPGDGTITRGQPEQLAGSLTVGQRLFSASGSFPGGGKNEAIDVGTVSIPAPCRVKCHIVGTPPVPNVWSLYNANSGLDLRFAARLGSGYGIEDSAIALGGLVENNDLTGEGDLPAPGRAHLIIGPPKGSGPLSGGDFPQGFTASVEVVKLLDSARAQGESDLLGGDSINAGAVPTQLRLRDGTLLTVMPGSRVKLTEPSPGMVRVELEAGWVRVTRWGAPHGQSTEITYKGQRLKPRGTDFVVRDLGQTARVEVLEGEVEYETAQGIVSVSAGERSVVGSGSVEPIPGNEIAGLGEPEVDGAPASIAAVDESRAPFGTAELTVSGGRLSEGWVLEDPDHDCTVEGAGSELRITVPTGNDLWDRTSTAPRVLRKATGDFDLEAELEPPATAEEWTGVDFCVKSLGSGLGILTRQMADFRARDYWLPADCWAWTANGGPRLRLWDDTHGPTAWPLGGAGPIQVRLSRRGSLWYASRSTDRGATWDLIGLQRAEAPATAWVGWVFKRQYSPAKSVFVVRSARLVTDARGCLATPQWLTATAAGATVEPAEGRVRFALDGSAIGSAQCLTAATLDGNFDLVVRYDCGADWAHQAGQSRGFAIGACSTDYRDYAYIGGALNNETGVARWHCDMKLNDGWGRYGWEAGLPPQGKLRLVRTDGQLAASYWKGNAWVPLSKWGDRLLKPLHLMLTASNEWGGAVPTAHSVTLTAESLSIGPDYPVEPEASPDPIVATGLGEPGEPPPPQGDPAGAQPQEPVVATEETVAPSPVSGLAIGTGATDDGKPIGEATHFAEATELCAFFRFKEAPVGTKIVIVWLREGTEESRDEMDIDGTGRAWFSLSCRPRFDEGPWEVQLRIGDALVARQAFRIGP